MSLWWWIVLVMCLPIIFFVVGFLFNMVAAATTLALARQLARQQTRPATGDNPDQNRSPTNRYVPFISGLAYLGLAVWLVAWFSGWWRYIPAALLLAFGWASVKTAFVASDKEIHELTSEGPTSEATREKFMARLGVHDSSGNSKEE